MELDWKMNKNALITSLSIIGCETNVEMELPMLIVITNNF
jgi:hypothetical protein